jgi:hypothetical protein
MKLKYHRTLTEEKWSKFPFSKQIIMIANELNRAKNWLIKNDLAEVKNCYERAFELLDLTINTTANKYLLLKENKYKNQLRELLRFREMFAEQYIKVCKQKITVHKMEQKLSVMYNVLLLLNKDVYNLLVNKVTAVSG